MTDTQLELLNIDTPLPLACEGLLEAKDRLAEAKEAVSECIIEVINELRKVGKDEVVYHGRIFAIRISEEKTTIQVRERT